MNLKHTFIIALAFTVFTQRSNADDSGLTKTVVADPVKVVVGYQDGGVGATAKGEYTTEFGSIRNGFTPGFNYGIDGAWNSNPKTPDQLSIATRLGLVRTGPGVPVLSGFFDVEVRDGQFEKDDKSLEKVNQLLIGITGRWVPKFFTNLMLDAAGAGNASDYPITECDAANLTDEERKKAGCDDPAKGTHPVLQFPPHFSLSYYHPVRNRSGATLPEGIEADKVTLSFDVDNHLYPSIKMPPHLIVSLSATKPTTGNDKKLETKIDAGIGIDVGKKFTPMIKYVSGKKDGFKFDKQVILGLLLHLADQ